MAEHHRRLPEVIIHNSVSLDSSFIGFDVNMELHYRLAGSYSPGAHLIGSNTATAGFEMFGRPPREKRSDFQKPKRDRSLPYWVVVDTKGALSGSLHALRRFEFCRDVIVLISEKTPKRYVDYLKERQYDYHVVGQRRANMKKALELLSREYGIRRVMTDTGRILSNLLLDRGLVKKISLLVHPVIVGKESENLFSQAAGKLGLRLKKSEVLGKGYVWLIYEVEPRKRT